MTKTPIRLALGTLVMGLVILTIVEGLAPASESGRILRSIDETWRYAPGDVPGAAAIDFVDTSWQVVNLPHTWNAIDAFDKTPGYRRGIGWYRKNLTGVELLPNRKYYIYFEGANQVADVFLNGTQVGRHVGGYTAFAVDITGHLNLNGRNVLAVRVDNSSDSDVPPLDADFTFYGGIYRDVWLLSTDEVHVDVLDHASPGIFVDTPEVSDTAASVRVRGRVLNESSLDRTIRVKSAILDGAETVAGFEIELQIAAGGEEPFEVATPELPDMKLWSPDSPSLYHLVTEVLDGERVVDRVTVPLGFRRIAYSGGGFFLNGKPLRLVGTNRHQDFPGYGNAVPKWVHRQDIKTIKDTGFNFLRLAHYPQDPVVLDETDRRGLVVWEEIPIVNRITLSKAFDENSERMLVEMIRQNYNHPSVMMWGFMNEVMLRPPAPLPDGYYEQLLALANRLDDTAKQEDPHRATVMAQSVEEVYNGKGLSDVTDILGMNLYFGWYSDTFDRLGIFLDRVHAAHPDRPLIVSEYGAGSDERVHARSPVAFDFSSEYAQDFHRASFKTIEARPYLLGSAVWNQFDFGSSIRQDTKNAINQKGLYFFDRKPKDVASYYQAALSRQPIVHIAREWSRRAGSRPEDALQPIWVYTNSPSIEMWVNGVSQGVQQTNNRRAAWMARLKNGLNKIRAAEVGAPETVTDQTSIFYDDRSGLFGPDARNGQVLAVNAGGGYQYVGRDEIVWEADRAYERGNWGYTGGKARLVHHRILGTDDDAFFQATRQNVEAYQFDVADGAYEVTVLLAETRGNRERRPFDVYVNEIPLWQNVSLARDAGSYVAVRRSTLVDAASGEGVTIRFNPAGSSTVSGILIRRK